MIKRFMSTALVMSVTTWFSMAVFEAALVKNDDAKIWITFIFLATICIGVAFVGGIVTGRGSMEKI